MNDPRAPARQRIVDQSLPLFSGCGYNGVSMNEIATAAGITRATLCYHGPVQDTGIQ